MTFAEEFVDLIVICDGHFITEEWTGSRQDCCVVVLIDARLKYFELELFVMCMLGVDCDIVFSISCLIFRALQIFGDSEVSYTKYFVV